MVSGIESYKLEYVLLSICLFFLVDVWMMFILGLGLGLGFFGRVLERGVLGLLMVFFGGVGCFGGVGLLGFEGFKDFFIKGLKLLRVLFVIDWLVLIGVEVIRIFLILLIWVKVFIGGLGFVGIGLGGGGCLGLGFWLLLCLGFLFIK